MQKVRIPMSNFSFGEVSDSVIMRTDTPIYQSSAQRIENMTVRAEGGVKRRFGLRAYDHLAIDYDASKRMQAKLFHFIFSDDERYVIAVSNAQIDIWRVINGGMSFVQTITQDVNTNALPFDTDYLHEYTHAQYGDVMFVCHPLFVPRMIVRTGLTNFEVQTYSFDSSVDDSNTYQPYTSFHGSGVTITPSAYEHVSGGSITLTSSESYFDTTGSQTGGDYLDSLHVGIRLVIGDSELNILSVQSATQCTAEIVSTYDNEGATLYQIRTRLSILNPFRTREGEDEIEVTHINHGLDVGNTVEFYHSNAPNGINRGDINGVRTIQEVIDENTYVFNAGGSNNATDHEDFGGYVSVAHGGAQALWAEQSFSALRGYPGAVVFHENRLVFAGTISQPDTVFMSKSGQYFNFNVGEGADADAIVLTAATGEVNEVRYLVSNRDLQIFTASSELYVPTYLNQSVTPTNAQIRQQTPYGIVFVEPQPLDGATLYIQTGGKVAREYLYTDTEEAYTSTAVSTIASHLLNDPKDSAVVHGAFQEAESYATIVMANGELALFGSNRSEKRAGWMRVTSGSDTYGFESVVAIDDRLFCLAWEHCTNPADGAEKNWLVLCEFFADYHTDFSTYGAASGSYLYPADSQLFQNAETCSLIGYASSGSEPIYIGTIAAESYLDGSDYKIRFDVSAYTSTYNFFEVGKSFNVQLTSNPIDVNVGNGFVTGDPRGISSAILDLRGSRSVTVNGTAYNPSASFDGKKEFYILGYGRDPQVTITQSQPLPLQVNGFIAELIV
jgi:hypothetical protein